MTCVHRLTWIKLRIAPRRERSRNAPTIRNPLVLRKNRAQNGFFLMFGRSSNVRKCSSELGICGRLTRCFHHTGNIRQYYETLQLSHSLFGSILKAGVPWVFEYTCLRNNCFTWIYYKGCLCLSIWFNSFIRITKRALPFTHVTLFEIVKKTW